MLRKSMFNRDRFCLQFAISYRTLADDSVVGRFVHLSLFTLAKESFQKSVNILSVRGVLYFFRFGPSGENLILFTILFF